jgi:16S rRNA (cytosine1402-N4)-methyltransferase
MTTFQHVPVLLSRVVDLLAPALAKPGAVLVDCTLGLGGHSVAVLSACPQARLIGLDRDQAALQIAKSRLAPFGERVTTIQANYSELTTVLQNEKTNKVSAVLFDLGVSSLQLDEPDRGFAYRHEGPLDMRMDQSSGESAAEVLNNYSATELTRVLRVYGEERFAAKIAAAIVNRRAQLPFTTSTELVELLYSVIPAAVRRTGGHPAKRTFQALRMEVNEELMGVKEGIPQALTAVEVGGRVVVESYHSLEDRMVKRAFANATQSGAPTDLPVVPDAWQPRFRLLTKGGEKADSAEVQRNPRAASVRLRAVERVAA